MDYNAIAAVIFVFLMVIFLYFKRSRIQIQRIFFPVLYFVMYKTRLGLKSMDYAARKFPGILKSMSFLGVIIGALGMIFIVFWLLKNTVNLLIKPGIAPGIQLVLPFEVKGVFFVPFIYWILAIFFIAAVHEFSHGIIARVYNIKIKSSGVAFLGVFLPLIPAAFVEPEEKQLVKKGLIAQLSVFAAGPFANILSAGIVILLVVYVAAPISAAAFDFDGVEVVKIVDDSSFAKAGIMEGEIIHKMENYDIGSVKNFTDVLGKYDVGDVIVIKTAETAYAVTLGEHPSDASKPYLGVSTKQHKEVKPSFAAKYGAFIPRAIEWLSGFLYWLFVLNLGIGLFNLLPLGPIDGGRMVKAALEKTSPKKGYLIWKYTSLFFFVLVLFNVIAGFL